VLGVFPYPEAEEHKTRLERVRPDLNIEITHISKNFYRVLIVPFEERDERVLQDLKNQRLIPNDAVWMELDY
jgi:hypothetical protein